MAKLFRILSIDGGGIRGILSGQLLVALEKKLQERSGNSSCSTDFCAPAAAIMTVQRWSINSLMIGIHRVA